MSTTDSMTSSSQYGEWIELDCIGEKGPNFIYPPTRSNNWTYSPSGSVCAGCVLLANEIDHDTFVFIDLVNKVTFSIKLYYYEGDISIGGDHCRMSNFYFNSEHEFVTVSDYNGIFKQRIYKLDYSNQRLELQDIILHSCTQRDDTPDRIHFYMQANKVVTYDRIDYIVLVGRPQYLGFGVRTHDIFMIPKNPIHQNQPVKEFQIHFELWENYENLKKKVREMLTDNQYLMDVSPNEYDCMLRGTTLCFGFNYVLHGSLEYHFSVIGAHLEVDLTKLIETSSRNVNQPTDMLQLMSEQVNCYKFVQSSELFLAGGDRDLWQYQHNVGVIRMFRNSSINNDEGKTMASFYPVSEKEAARSVVLNLELQADPMYIGHSYSLHPHGALLNFACVENEYREILSMHVRVLKCLRPNLMSLALNRALFQKNTPLRKHHVYRICFNAAKPIEYNNNVDKKCLKRKFVDH